MHLVQRFSILVVASLFIFTVHGKAQSQGKVYEAFHDAKVKVNGSFIYSPWCGGINSVQINHVDLNNDSKNDLVLYDQNTASIKTFLNIGTAGEIKYEYASQFEKNFPSIFNYMILKDYNCDGIPDLFHKGLPGVSVWKGYYQSNELKFTYYKDLYFPGSFGPVNVFVQPDDIPGIVDVDGDGDLDVLAYGVNGNLLEFTRNRRVEDGLSCDSMRMELVDACWGKFNQGFNRAAALGITCKGVSSSNHKTRHTGNCIAAFDIDGDLDLDILGGNLSFSDAQLLVNGGSTSISQVTSQDTTYNILDHILKMPSWPAPFHVDIDNDGDKDILFTSHDDNAGTANFNAVAFYKNTGSDASPNFQFQHDSLLTPEMIDVGSFSYPTFFDLDKDGKLDLFIGTEGYMNNATNTKTSMLAYYKNTSTVGSTSFELITKDYLNLSSHGYNGIFPTFGDITGDGVLDLVLGTIKGTIAVYKNYTSSNTVPPNFMLQTDSLAGVSVGKNSAPLIFDFDQDGRTDLLVGNQAGYLYYYEDTSTTSAKKFSLQTISLGNFKAGDVSNLYGYCVPIVAKMDNTGKDFLVIGNIDGTIARYDNFINNLGNFARIDSNYSFIKTISRSVPAIADLDGDGNYEMIIGNRMGGLSYFKQVKNVLDGVDDITLNASSVDVYPNPAQDQIQILVKSDIGTRTIQLDIIDLSGQVVLSSDAMKQGEARLNISHLNSGMYLAQISIGNQKLTKKFIKSSK